jgi:hypothetical protein
MIVWIGTESISLFCISRGVAVHDLRSVRAALASVRYGFADLGLERIIGLVMPDNISSRRSLGEGGSPRCGCWKKPGCAMPRPFLSGTKFAKYMIEASEYRL